MINPSHLVSWKMYNLLILFLLVINFIDYETTRMILDAGGMEANPLMDAVITATGALWPVLVIKYFFIGILWLGCYLIAEVTIYLYIILGALNIALTGVVARSIHMCHELGLF